MRGTVAWMVGISLAATGLIMLAGPAAWYAAPVLQRPVHLIRISSGANIGPDDAMILAHAANPDGSNFRKGHLVKIPSPECDCQHPP
jgi:hypothetical protein